MNVSLTPKLERLVRKHVASGRYGSASEVIRESLRLLESRDRDVRAQLNRLKSDVARGLDDLRRGRYVDLDDAGLDALAEDVKRRGRRQRALPRRKRA